MDVSRQSIGTAIPAGSADAALAARRPMPEHGLEPDRHGADAPGPACDAARCATGSVSGLPVPRFVSLKSDRVNVRVGPDQGP